MKTKNEDFHKNCGMLEAFNDLAYDLKTRRYDVLEKTCEILNNKFIMKIRDLGFPNSYFYIQDFICESPKLVLCFGEKLSQKDFRTEEAWMDHQCKNMETLQKYLDAINQNLDILCLPREQDE